MQGVTFTNSFGCLNPQLNCGLFDVRHLSEFSYLRIVSPWKKHRPMEGKDPLSEIAISNDPNIHKLRSNTLVHTGLIDLSTGGGAPQTPYLWAMYQMPWSLYYRYLRWRCSASF
jgi:hypothetical protein